MRFCAGISRLGIETPEARIEAYSFGQGARLGIETPEARIGIIEPQILIMEDRVGSP